MEGGHIKRWYGAGLDLQRLFILSIWIFSEPMEQSQNLHLNKFFIYFVWSFGLMRCLFFSDRANRSSGGWGSREVLAYSVAGIPSVTDDFSILVFSFSFFVASFLQKR